MRGTNKPNRLRTASESTRFSPITIALSIAFVIALALLLWWFRANFEKVTSINYKLNNRVQYNPFYAAELLINRQHSIKNALDAEAVKASDNKVGQDNKAEKIASTLLDSSLQTLLDDLPVLPNANGDINQIKTRPTLLINNVSTKLTDERFNILRQWIKEGGHLITFTKNKAGYKEMQAVHEHLDTLKSSKMSSEDIAQDEELARLIEALDSGNQFLAKLGIFAVGSKTSSDDNMDDDVDDQMEAMVEAMDAQDSDNKVALKKDKALYKQAIVKLKDFQPMSMLITNNRTLNKSLNNEPANLSDNVLMIQTQHLGQHLDTQIFQTLYSDSTNIKDVVINEQTEESQANINRSYLHRQMVAVNAQLQAIESSTSKEQDDTLVATAAPKAQQKKRAIQLIHLLKSLLEMSDKELLGIFKPINEVYLDSSFGNGRLSVILNNSTFTNPDPNLVLPRKRAGTKSGVMPDNDTSRALLSPILTSQDLLNVERNLFSSNFSEVTLYSADNAAWLGHLTEHSDLVWILPNTDIDPLPVMLWEKARLAVLGLGLLAFIWLWSLYNRFGKRQVLSQMHAYDILQYFRQVGRYGWQQDKAIKLTRVTRERVKLQVEEALLHAPQALTADAQEAVSQDTQSETRHIDLSQSQNVAVHSKTLHTLLLARLQERRQHKGESQDRVFAAENYSAIKALIVPQRLRQALSPTIQDGITAAEFTEMTQTLWVINWLLS